MFQSVEAVVDHDGALRMMEPVELPLFRRVIITILDEESEDWTDFSFFNRVPLFFKREISQGEIKEDEEDELSYLDQLPVLDWLTEITDQYVMADEPDIDIDDIYKQRRQTYDRGIIFD
ncbi:MAG: hypothetical protein AAF639_47215 [Chloroflexota bacterium]